MKIALILVFVMLIISNLSFAQTALELFNYWEKEKISNILPSQARHKDVKNYLETLKKQGIKVREVGRSVSNREIYEMEFGRGKTEVLMWSQMHGDEPTATSALFDLFAFLQNNRKLKWVKEIEDKLTIRAVPMLNPDGAEIFQRRNAQFLDINRDARDLQTPEGILLKKLRDEWSPDLGFNLHNQNPRYAAGKKGKQVTVGFLAVASDEAKTDTPGRLLAKRLCSVMIQSANKFIEGHIGRYDDTYNERAFGDQMSRWGTPTILIETGGLYGKDEFYLVRLNFLIYLSALHSLANGTEKQAQPEIYDALPENESGEIFDLIIRKVHVVNRFQIDDGLVKPFIADLAINAEQRQTSGDLANSAYIQDLGDLLYFRGLEEIDGKNYYATVSSGVLRVGVPAEILFYQKDKAAKIDWTAKDLEKKYPPDGIYKNGVWVKKLK